MGGLHTIMLHLLTFILGQGPLLVHAMMAATLAILHRQAQDIFELSSAPHDQNSVPEGRDGNVSRGNGETADTRSGYGFRAEVCSDFDLRVLRVSSLDGYASTNDPPSNATISTSSEKVRCSDFFFPPSPSQ